MFSYVFKLSLIRALLIKLKFKIIFIRIGIEKQYLKWMDKLGFLFFREPMRGWRNEEITMVISGYNRQWNVIQKCNTPYIH